MCNDNIFINKEDEAVSNNSRIELICLCMGKMLREITTYNQALGFFVYSVNCSAMYVRGKLVPEQTVQTQEYKRHPEGSTEFKNCNFNILANTSEAPARA